MERSNRKPPNEHKKTSKPRIASPQVFWNFEFGVSFSENHAPNKHSITFKSRNVRNSRDVNQRQAPPRTKNFLIHPTNNHHREQSHNHYDYQVENDHGGNRRRLRQDSSDEQTYHQDYRTDHASVSRALPRDRGRSAPPPFNDQSWDIGAGPSADMVSSRQTRSRWDHPPAAKPLPPNPPSHTSFRLGEVGLPWCADTWPVDPFLSEYGDDEIEEGTCEGLREEGAFPYSNKPTTLSLDVERRKSDEDPTKIENLEKLSVAMVTVDNGFENKWRCLEPREPLSWLPRDQGEPMRATMLGTTSDLSTFEHSMDGRRSPSDYDPTPSVGTADYLVSPLSTHSGPFRSPRQLPRSYSIRSEELFF